MNAGTWLPLSTLALMAFTACGGNTDTTPTGSTSTGAAATTSSGAGGSDSSTATTGAGSGTGGAAGETLTLTMETFTIAPGEEVYKCQNYKNPFAGVPTDVSAFESHMTSGSHHLLLFYKKNASDGALEKCFGTEFAATPYSTQLPDDSLEFPAGIAAQIPANQGFRLQSHYLNTTDKPIEAHVEVTFHLAKPGTVTDHAGVLFVPQLDINAPANMTTTIDYACKLPFDMNLIKAGSHMHKHGTKFDATIGTAPNLDTLVSTTQWDEPEPVQFAPAKALKGGDTLSFHCTFANNTPNTLTFGESAENSEMCIFVGSFYPVPAGVVTVGCN